MEKQIGLMVVYTDQDIVSWPASIMRLNDDGTVYLAVFIPENQGFRNDQTSVQYSDAQAPNTWSNLS